MMSPCHLIGPGHAPTPITHWRRMAASDRYELLELVQVGPDTLELVLGPRLDGQPLPRRGGDAIRLTYCTHDVAAVLRVWAGRDTDTRMWLHGAGPTLEWSGEDRVIHRFALAEPYRYVPCRDVVVDPRDPFRTLSVPRIPELDQLVRAGLLPADPGSSRPATQEDLDAAWEEDEAAEDADELLDALAAELGTDVPDDEELEDDELDEDEDGEDDGLVGDVVATLRIGASGWFEGGRSELLAVGPEVFGCMQRWDPSDPGEPVTWEVAAAERSAATLRWAVDELDRILDGFPGGRHLLRLIADGTVEDRFELRCDGDEGEETFRVRLVLTPVASADTAAVRAAAAALVDADRGWTADGVRADGAWTLVVPGRRVPPRKRVVVPLARDDE